MDYYGTVEDFLDYVEAHGYDISDVPTSPVDAIEGALRRASSYIDGVYRSRFSGKRTAGRSQTLEWPRTGAVDAEDYEIPDDEIPDEIERATYEAAVREAQAPGSLMPDYIASEEVQSERVGPLAVTYKSSSSMSGRPTTWPQVGVIDGILAPLLGTPPSMLFGQVERI